MKIYKLSAISSTNDYLNALASETTLENYTIVSTDFQLHGKGQLENTWHSDKGKNLLFSILIKINEFKIIDQSYLNFAISLAIYDVLKLYLDDIIIKWPNDILSRQNKICGILIENSVKSDKITHSIVGIGINVNQTKFPEYLKKVTSMKLDLKKDMNRDLLLEKVLFSIKKYVNKIENKQLTTLKNDYISVLYRINKPAMFEDKNGIIFMGKIIDVSNYGKLLIELNDESIREFEVKEVKFI